ncbi:cytochrome P450, partial [Myxococcota bacterium]|nr:cytochrome P450 [Myxococcota bacterium]
MFEFDPHSHELHDDPYPVYRKLREEHPVLWNPTHRFWSVARYDDVMAGLKRPLAFSSDRSRLESSRNPSQSMPMMITMDPPGHDELRSLVNRAFTPRRMAHLEERIRGIATELIDGFIDRGSCDLWADFAAPLPTSVIASLLGVPPEDGEMFKEKSTAVVAASGPVGGPRSNAIVDLATYLGQVFEEKRKRPADDLMSELLVAEIDGRRLDTGELLGFAILLLIAGN